MESRITLPDWLLLLWRAFQLVLFFSLCLCVRNDQSYVLGWWKKDIRIIYRDVTAVRDKSRKGYICDPPITDFDTPSHFMFPSQIFHNYNLGQK